LSTFRFAVCSLTRTGQAFFPVWRSSSDTHQTTFLPSRRFCFFVDHLMAFGTWPSHSLQLSLVPQWSALAMFGPCSFPQGPFDPLRETLLLAPHLTPLFPLPLNFFRSALSNSCLLVPPHPLFTPGLLSFFFLSLIPPFLIGFQHNSSFSGFPTWAFFQESPGAWSRAPVSSFSASFVASSFFFPTHPPYDQLFPSLTSRGCCPLETMFIRTLFFLCFDKWCRLSPVPSSDSLLFS